MKRLNSKISKLSAGRPVWFSPDANEIIESDGTSFSCMRTTNRSEGSLLVFAEGEEYPAQPSKPVFVLKRFKNPLDAIKTNLSDGSTIEKGWKRGFLQIGQPLYAGSWWVFYLVFAVLMLGTATIPHDDLLRHIVAYQFDYDYSNIYLNGYLPEGKFYLTFDWMVGWVHRLLIGNNPLNPYPLVIVCSFLALVILEGFRRNIRHLKPSLQLVLIAVLLLITDGRLYFGRPCTLTTGLFLFAIAIGKKSDSSFKHLLIGSFLAVSYWISWAYLIPLAIWRRIYFFPLALGIAFWSWAMNGSYFKTIYQLLTNLEDTRFKIIETENIFIFGGVVFTFLLIIAVFIHINEIDLKQGSIRSLATKVWDDFNTRPAIYFALFFTLPLQYRYTEIIVPLLLISLAPGLQRLFEKTNIKEATVLFFAFAIFFEATDLLAMRMNDPSFLPTENMTKKLSGKKVMTLQSHMYPLVYGIPGIKTSPSMNMHWADEGIKNLMGTIGRKGDVDCSVLRQYDFDYLVDTKQMQIGSETECLKLDSVERRYRIWKVKKGK